MYAMNGALSMLNRLIYIITCVLIFVFIPIAILIVALKAAIAYVDDAVEEQYKEQKEKEYFDAI